MVNVSSNSSCYQVFPSLPSPFHSFTLPFLFFSSLPLPFLLLLSSSFFYSSLSSSPFPSFTLPFLALTFLFLLSPSFFYYSLPSFTLPYLLLLFPSFFTLPFLLLLSPSFFYFSLPSFNLHFFLLLSPSSVTQTPHCPYYLISFPLLASVLPLHVTPTPRPGPPARVLSKIKMEERKLRRKLLFSMPMEVKLLSIYLPFLQMGKILIIKSASEREK